MKVSYPWDFFQKITILRVKKSKFGKKKIKIRQRNHVGGLPLALNKDAESASWVRFRRAAKRKIYKKMYHFELYCDAELLVFHQKVIFYHSKASIAAS